FMREREVFGAIRHSVSSAINARTSVVPPANASDPRTEQALEQLSLPVDIPDSGPLQSSIVAPARAMPTLRVLGQAGSLFIIAEGPDGVYMLDQHAAHERVLFDELCAQTARSRVPSQSLLEPLLCEVGSSGMDVLVEESPLLEEMGFLVEPF